ncbi:MAG TPA: acetate uptake transporter [Ktedonobacterales bacterium]|nr:acetate uptake transporter [Ktedonobacterales bacterium]
MAQQLPATPSVAPGSADPAPLGLSGLALTTFVLSVVNAGIIIPHPLGNQTIFIGVAVFYGGLALILAGMWEFRAGNTFNATAFTSYGAFWLSLAAVFIPGFGIGSTLKDARPAVGLVLLGWTIFTGLMTLGAYRRNGALLAVFVALFLAFLALTIGFLGTNTRWIQIGGWLGIITALLAWYTALAGIMTSVSNGKIALPVFPLS